MYVLQRHISGVSYLHITELNSQCIRAVLCFSVYILSNTIVTTSLLGFGSLFFVIIVIYSKYNFKEGKDEVVPARALKPYEDGGDEASFILNLGYS
jgi:hypothetical protein